MTITFFVPGIPCQQGSKRAFARGGKAWLVEAKADANRTWRNQVAAYAQEAVGNPLEGPLEVKVQFLFPKPKTLRKAEREIDPLYRATGPDLDKLCRSLGDGLTGIAYADDRQICHWDAKKAFTSGKTGARIEIRQLGGE